MNSNVSSNFHETAKKMILRIIINHTTRFLRLFEKRDFNFHGCDRNFFTFLRAFEFLQFSREKVFLLSNSLRDLKSFLEKRKRILDCQSKNKLFEIKPSKLLYNRFLQSYVNLNYR